MAPKKEGREWDLYSLSGVMLVFHGCFLRFHQLVNPANAVVNRHTEKHFPPADPPTELPICQSVKCMSVCLFLYASMHLSLYLSLCPSIFLSVYLSIYLSLSLTPSPSSNVFFHTFPLPPSLLSTILSNCRQNSGALSFTTPPITM